MAKGHYTELDLLVHRDNMSFRYELYIKPTHSGIVLPKVSDVSESTKFNTVWNEGIRATRNSSDEEMLARSKTNISNRFRNNGYTKKFISRAFNKVPSTTQYRKPVTFLRLPFINEAFKRNVVKLARRTEVAQNMRIIFTSSAPLKRRFRAPYCPPKCVKNYVACTTAKKQGKCYIKYAVYKIS